MEKNLYIIRHGETEFNRLGIIQGSSVDSSLNETGKWQAELFYKKYKSNCFDFVYTSALKRTYESVRKFIELENITHRTLTELNEICWGDLENAQPEPDWKQVYSTTVNAWKAGNLHLGIANGESPLQVQARLCKAIEDIESNSAKNILICMHGRALKIMLCTLIGVSLNRMEDFAHSNLCLYHLKKTNGLWQIEMSNNITHLTQISS